VVTRFPTSGINGPLGLTWSPDSSQIYYAYSTVSGASTTYRIQQVTAAAGATPTAIPTQWGSAAQPLLRY